MSEITEKKVQNQQSNDHPMDFKPNILDRWVVRIGNIIAGFYLIAVFITIFEVVMRYVFHAPTQWVFEVSIMLVGSAMLYGGAYCMSNNGHIRVTVVTDALPESVQKSIQVVIAFLTLIFMLSLCYAAFFMVNKAFYAPDGAWRPERSGSAFNSFLPAEIKAVLLFVVILMALQSTLQFFQSIARLLGGKKDA